jgi:hypothetical protein
MTRLRSAIANTNHLLIRSCGKSRGVAQPNPCATPLAPRPFFQKNRQSVIPQRHAFWHKEQTQQTKSAKRELVIRPIAEVFDGVTTVMSTVPATRPVSSR